MKGFPNGANALDVRRTSILTRKHGEAAMPRLPSLVAVGSIYQVLIWVVLAFCFWLLLTLLIRRLQVPSPVLVAAALSWIVAWLFIWAVPRALPEVWFWSIK